VKKLFGIALVVSLVLAGFAVISPVYAQSGAADTGLPGGPWGGPGRGPGGTGQPENAPEMGLMKDYMLEYLAETFELDLEDTQARLDEGEKLSQILLDAGVEDVPQALWDAREYAFNLMAEEGYGPEANGEQDGFFSRMLDRMRDRLNLENRDGGNGTFPPRFSADGKRPSAPSSQEGCPAEGQVFTPRGRGGRQ